MPEGDATHHQNEGKEMMIIDSEETSHMAVQQLYPPPPRYYAEACPASGCVLEPPPLPQHPDTYQCFGEMYSVEPGMPMLQVSQEFERLDDGSVDIKEQLLKLHARLVDGSEELLETLARDPSAYARKVEHLGLLFRNMQYLVNLLRPLQARRTMVDVLEQRAARVQGMLDALAQAMSAGEALCISNDSS